MPISSLHPRPSGDWSPPVKGHPKGLKRHDKKWENMTYLNQHQNRSRRGHTSQATWQNITTTIGSHLNTQIWQETTVKTWNRKKIWSPEIIIPHRLYLHLITKLRFSQPRASTNVTRCQGSLNNLSDPHFGSLLFQWLFLFWLEWKSVVE
jgi:hypothetical protein